MTRYLYPIFALTTSLGVLACGGSSQPTRTVARQQAVPQGSPILADETSSLAGDILRARLPRGPATEAESGTPLVGELVRSTHTISLASGELRVVAADTARSAEDDFATRIVEHERRTRCAPPANEVAPERIETNAAGLEVAIFTPDTACNNAAPPAARLWVKTSEASVISVTFECGSSGCLADRDALLTAFIATLEPGTSTETPAGPRSIGPEGAAQITLDLPEGYFVRRSGSAEMMMFEVFKRRAFDAPPAGVSFAFAASPLSASAVRDDYAREGLRPRNVNGRVAGQSARLVEFSHGASVERIARIRAGSGSVDVVIMAPTGSQSLTELVGIVSSASLR